MCLRSVAEPHGAPDAPESVADPGVVVLPWLDAALGEERMSVPVPLAVRKIVPEHGRRSLRLADDAQRHVGLGEPLERLFHVARRLVLGNNLAEAVDGCRIIAALQIVSSDLHLLGGEL